MSFEKTVNAVSQLTGAYRKGLQALREPEKGRIICKRQQTRRLCGSVNMDVALKQICPDNQRWDYGIGWKSHGREEAIWIEFHDANSSHVNVIIQKVNWLKDWLKENAPALLNMTRPKDGYIWIATDGIYLQKNSRQYKQLAYAGGLFPQKCLRLY